MRAVTFLLWWFNLALITLLIHNYVGASGHPIQPSPSNLEHTTKFIFICIMFGLLWRLLLRSHNFETINPLPVWTTNTNRPPLCVTRRTHKVKMWYDFMGDTTPKIHKHNFPHNFNAKFLSNRYCGSVLCKNDNAMAILKLIVKTIDACFDRAIQLQMQ